VPALMATHPVIARLIIECRQCEKFIETLSLND